MKQGNSESHMVITTIQNKTKANIPPNNSMADQDFFSMIKEESLKNNKNHNNNDTQSYDTEEKKKIIIKIRKYEKLMNGFPPLFSSNRHLP